MWGRWGWNELRDRGLGVKDASRRLGEIPLRGGDHRRAEMVGRPEWCRGRPSTRSKRKERTRHSIASRRAVNRGVRGVGRGLVRGRLGII